MLQRHTISYFSNLYTIDNYVTRPFSVWGRFPKLDHLILVGLSTEITLEEMRQLIFSMSPLKAPGVDDLYAKFIRQIGKLWELVSIIL